MAGTPCPFEGAIGAKAKQQWKINPEELPVGVTAKENRLVDNEDVTYQLYTKEEFCAKNPKEDICV